MKQPVSPTQKMLNTWAIVIIIWSIYRTTFRTELPIWFDEFIAKPLIFIIPIHFFITRIEKKDFFQSVDLRLKHISRDFLIGLGVGMIFIVTGGIAFLIKHQSFSHLMRSSFTLSGFLYILATATVTSITEEILSRGFVLKRLYDESRNLMTAVFFSSFLFFMTHIPMLFTNPELRGNALLQVMFTDILFSFAVSFIYLQRRSLFIPIVIHAFYTVSIYLFL